MRLQSCAVMVLYLLALLFSAALPAQESNSATSDAQRLQQLLDADWRWTMTEFPEFATFVGYPGQNARWSDKSLDAIQRRKQHSKEMLKTLESIDRPRLSAADQLNYDLFRRLLKEDIEGQRFPSEYLAITQLSGPQQEVARVIDAMPTFTLRDYENIIARLDGAPKLIDQTIALLNKGVERSVTPPKVTLRDVPEQVRNQMVDDPGLSPLLRAFSHFPDAVPPADRERLAGQARAALSEKVVPAYRKLYDYLTQTYLPRTRETIGLSELPDGQAWYAHEARVSTTTDMTLKQIHELGLAEVKRLRGEIDKVIASSGFSGGFAQFKKFLQTDSRFLFTDAQSCLMAYRDIAKRADPQLVKLFGKLPRLPYGVIPMPEYAGKSQTAAYYQGGSLRVGRPGNFVVNTYDLRSHQKWQMEVLTLHEAVPGHHLQIAIAQELQDAPEFRKHLGVTAFVEGWGLYAESLGYEMGFYTDPYSKFGQLNYEMWRAVRLVLDTGIHAVGWSRQQAIDYFLENTALSEHEVTVEVDRYIAWPGQALAYKIGQLKIRLLRLSAQSQLGEKFDLRSFHDELLGAGALPLDVLEARMKQWVEQQKAKPSARMNGGQLLARAGHRGEEFAVGLGLGQPAQQQLHGFDRRERVQHLAQHPDAVQLIGWQQQLFLARAGAIDVDGGEDALVHQPAVEVDLHVAGALELLEDDVVHAAAGIDQGGGDDRERAALLDVAGGGEEAPGPLEGVGIDAAGEDFARGRGHGVIGARQAGDGVEQDDDVALVFDQAFGLLQHHFRHLDVALRRLIERRADHLALDRALHVGDFLGPLVNQEHDQRDLGMVCGDRVGDRLQHHGLAGAGWRDDQPPLALADRAEQVEHAPGEVFFGGFHLQAALRVERGQIVEEDLVARHLGVLEVDGLHLDQREVALAVLGRAHLPRNSVAGAQVKLADLRWRDVDVVGPGQVVVLRRAQEAEAVGQALEHPFGEDQAVFLRLGAQDLEDQLLLAHAAGAGDVQLLGDLGQVGDVSFFQFSKANAHRFLSLN